MDALELLLERHSVARLTAPAPQGEVLDDILRAGLRAPDHGGLKPWRYLLVRGEGLFRLGELFAQAARSDGDNGPQLDKALNAPSRAPLVIVAIASPKAHDKVPEVEQLLSTGCGVHAMQMAAQAQGFNGIWRTGKWAYHPLVKQGLGLAPDEQIVGYLYLGTPECAPPRRRPLAIDDYVQEW